MSYSIFEITCYSIISIIILSMMYIADIIQILYGPEGLLITIVFVAVIMKAFRIIKNIWNNVEWLNR